MTGLGKISIEKKFKKLQVFGNGTNSIVDFQNKFTGEDNMEKKRKGRR